MAGSSCFYNKEVEEENGMTGSEAQDLGWVLFGGCQLFEP